MVPFSDFTNPDFKLKKFSSFENAESSPVENKRSQFYLEYYKNLSPSGFDVNLYGDSIVIKVQ